MIALAALLVVVGIVVGIGYAVRTAARRGPLDAGSPEVPSAVVPARRDLADDLTRWTAEGLLTEDQRVAILARERRVAALPPPPPPAREAAAPAPEPPHRVPLAAEALGYLGGTLGIVGMVLIISRYWPDLATPWRLLLSGLGALALFGAGLLVRESADPALARLRAFLWLVSTVAVGLFAVVAARDGFGFGHPASVVAACAGTVAVYSAALWRWGARPVQQLTTLAGLVVFVGAAMSGPAGASVAGGAVWLVGVGYVLVALRREVPSPLLTEGIGAVAMIVGATMVAVDIPGAGQLFAAVSAMCVLSVAVVPLLGADRADRALLGGLGTVAFLQCVPSTIGHFSGEAALATGLVVWSLGAALVVVGARRLVGVPTLVEATGCVALLVGAAVTAAQFPGFAPVFGIITSIGLVVLGMLPGRVMLSLFGTLGLLVNVPWAIARFFPGEGRAPVLIMVSGVMLVAVAVVLARLGGRVRSELGDRRRRPSGPVGTGGRPVV